jgi:enoyl-[acyl-carrier protein] reductase II
MRSTFCFLESDTIYGKNFDGLYARVMRSESGIEAMRKPMNPLLAAYKSFGTAQKIGMPMWKVIGGIATQWDKIYQLALFGAATEKLMAATIDGDLKNGVQFIGQSCGLIQDIPTVKDLLDRCIRDAIECHTKTETKIARHED